jgi:hypothetical protein
MSEDKISKDKQVYLLEHFLGGAIAIHVASLVGGKAKTAYCFPRLREIIAYYIQF